MFTSDSSPKERRAILLTSFRTGADLGSNLGVPGYSYDILTQMFKPLLARFGEVIEVDEPRENLDRAVADTRGRGLTPLHVGVLPPQNITLAREAPNVVVLAWEYPDVPDHVFDGNPQNDWVRTSQRCAVLVVGGAFTADALRRAGVRRPIRIVRVPISDDTYRLAPWEHGRRTRFPVRPFVLHAPHCEDAPAPADAFEAAPQDEPPEETPRPKRKRLALRSPGLKAWAREAYRRRLRRFIPYRLNAALKGALDGFELGLARSRVPYPQADGLELSGVVYTSVLNPVDGRKNWQDLLSGFVVGMRDCEDATLVVKIAASHQNAAYDMLDFYRGLQVSHRCRVALIPEWLTDEQMLRLAEATTYYVTATRAEGVCLPLMSYLAAGRPAVSPSHTAIADYFSEDIGFVVESHPEPTAFPHDSRLRVRTTWRRIVWASLAEQLQESYRVARHDRAAYDAMAERARRHMSQWSVENAWPSLREALSLALQSSETNREVPRTAKAA